MTQAPMAAPAAEAPTAVTFRRTVDRGLAHRAAVSEVFVTDVVTVHDRRALVGVQLPPTHAYYGDHLAEPAPADVVLVLEACRQAAICGAHAAPDIPTGTSMIVDSFAVEVTDPARLLPGEAPIDLVVETDYLGEVPRSGRVRNGRVEQRLLAGGVPVGTHEMDVMFVRGSQHDALRRAQRGSRPPSTTDLLPPDPAPQVPPAHVGRVHPRNVVLSGVTLAEGALSATVTPDPRNRGLFDHAYDHLPAMVLTEAARQLALLALDRPAETCAVALRSKFLKFAELDAPLLVSTALPAGPPTGPVDVPTVFVQDGAVVAETTVTLIPTQRLEQR